MLGIDDSWPQALRQRLKEERAALFERWTPTADPRALQRANALLVDKILVELWAGSDIPRATLVAVGGYGRGELAPFSDIDLLILIDEGVTEEELLEPVSRFLGAAWDVGLDLGHSLRTHAECMEQARGDLTVATALLETRLLAGDRARFHNLQTAWREFINPQEFARGKLQELRQRHARFQDSAYSLEPNVKESPGGLRDLQVIAWISQAMGAPRGWRSLAGLGLLTDQEARQLARQERILQTIRSQLHLTAGRREDRLVFDLQSGLAERMGFVAASRRRASELLMQRYFRAAKMVLQLSNLVLTSLQQTQWRPASADEAAESAPPGRTLDDVFLERDGLIDIRDPAILLQDSSQILRAFLWMGQASNRLGMTPQLLRGIWNARERLDAGFRRDPHHRQLFLEIFKLRRGVVHCLRLLNNLGLLGRMLPVFRRIVGQMQHDLFHVYTVDQHIMQVLRNLRRLTMPEHAHEFPLLTELMANFGRPWQLYLAALFHDIAKGRGGDHSDLGAMEVRRFCRTYQLDAEATGLLVFLVKEHLTMSTVAQKQDIHDPDVVNSFVERVKTTDRLTALYLLTVCDVRGTSPKVWNNWKGRLLEELYRRTLAVLEAGATAPVEFSLQRERREAERLLQLQTRDLEDARAFWKELDISYFLQTPADDIAWHARVLTSRRRAGDQPQIAARMSPGDEGLQVMVYQPDAPGLFARITAYFERQGLSVMDAQLHSTRKGHALDVFLVDHRAFPGSPREMMAMVQAELLDLLSCETPLPAPGQGRLSRQSKAFPVAPSVSLTPDQTGQTFQLELTGTDRTGLLYCVAYTLHEQGVSVHAARITTLGGRIEDRFRVSGESLQSEKGRLQIEAALLSRLGSDCKSSYENPAAA